MRTEVQLEFAKFAIAKHRLTARSAVKSCESSVATSTSPSIPARETEGKRDREKEKERLRGSSDFISISMGNRQVGKVTRCSNKTTLARASSSCHRLCDLRESEKEKEKKGYRNRDIDRGFGKVECQACESSLRRNHPRDGGGAG